MCIKVQTKLQKADSRKGGFTLIELLVVIAIIGHSGRPCCCRALSQLPSKRRYKEVQCMSNTRQIIAGLADVC